MNFNFSLDGIETALNRIADALDRLNPPVDLESAAIRKKRGPEAIIRYGDNKTQWLRENVETLVHEQGLSPEMEDQEREKLLADLMSDDLLDPEGHLLG